MKERCALDTLLSAGGPVRVAVRPCCLAALVGRRRPARDASANEGAAENPSTMCAGVEGTVGDASMVSEMTAGDASMVCAGADAAVGDASMVCAAAEFEMRVSP